MKRHNDLPLKDVLRLFLRQYKYRGRLDQVRIKVLWEKLMGPTINEMTTDITIRNGKVSITIQSAALRQELSFSTDKIRNLFNEHLNDNTVREVVIR